MRRAVGRLALGHADLGRRGQRLDLAEGLEQQVEVVDAVALQPAAAERRVLHPGERARARLGVVVEDERDRDHPRRAGDLRDALQQPLARLLEAAAVVDDAATPASSIAAATSRASREVHRERLLAEDVQAAVRAAAIAISACVATGVAMWTASRPGWASSSSMSSVASARSVLARELGGALGRRDQTATGSNSSSSDRTGSGTFAP